MIDPFDRERTNDRPFDDVARGKTQPGISKGVEAVSIYVSGEDRAKAVGVVLALKRGDQVLDLVGRHARVPWQSTWPNCSRASFTAYPYA